MVHMDTGIGPVTAGDTYRVRFFCSCPTNGARIDYLLTIRTEDVLAVEAILIEVGKHEDGFHEEIADALQAALGGKQTLVAAHHGVEIETERP